MSKGWFEVDKKGLRSLVAGKPKSFILRELIQNCWDEPKVAMVKVRADHKGGGIASITVEDDAPEGFVTLTHAFTLFADTRKRSNPETRGRFNLGEKLVLSLCQWAKIITTKGGVEFLADGTRKSLRTKRERGSEVSLELRLSHEEFDEMLAEARRFIPPVGIFTTINGYTLQHRQWLKRIPAKLETEIAHENNGEKILRRSQHKTLIEVYEVSSGEKGTLYEMGLPICETDDQYHYNIMQKVPLALDRETVPAAYLRAVRAQVLNEMVSEVKEDDASAQWVREAMCDKRIQSEVVKQIITKRFGDKVVAFTPGDTHGCEEAIRHGYRVVYPAELSKEEWQNVRGAETISSTKAMFPQSFTLAGVVPVDEWTPEQKRAAEFAKFLAQELWGLSISVEIWKSSQAGTVAQFNSELKRLSFNASKIAKPLWATPAQGYMLETIVHELGHRDNAGHFEDAYHKTLCEIAARLPRISKEHPEWGW